MADKVVKEYDRINQYRVRLLEVGKGVLKLDIREYIKTDGYTGFTKKGIRYEIDGVKSLGKIIQDILKDMSA